MLKMYEEYKGFKDKMAYCESVLKNNYFQLIDGKWSNSKNLAGDFSMENRKEVFTENGKLVVEFGEVYGSFSCSSLDLTTLEGCPTKVIGGGFSCAFNDLTSLEGGPISVDGYYYATHNYELTSIKGIATKIGGTLLLHSSRKLKTFFGLHEAELERDSFEGTSTGEVERSYVRNSLSGIINNGKVPLDQNKYFSDLLYYAIDNDPKEIARIQWPENFIESKGGLDNLLKSAGGLYKFNL